MSRADRAGGILLLVFALWFGVAARQYPYWSETGPGSGFLPFWLSLAMGILAVLLLFSAARPGSAGDEAWAPRGASLVRIVAVGVTTVVFVLVMEYVGMILGTGLFLFVMLRLVERYPWTRSIGVALGGAAGTYLLFVHWLRVPFPAGPFGF
jgi:hypothetical protein